MVVAYLTPAGRARGAAVRRLPPFGAILQVLRRFALLPAIFFLKSRADCDAALELCRGHEPASGARRRQLAERIALLADGQDRLRHHRQRGALEGMAVGAHHSGQLPGWKLLLETLMIEGLLDAIFATSTVAAGVNFPARSIVLLNSDRFNGREFLPLTATEFHQMAGRAGRRGMDRIGFAIALPGAFMDLRHLARLLNAPPGEVASQIRVNFSMVLNLLLSHRPAEIEDLLSRSLAAFSLRRRSASPPAAGPASHLDLLVEAFREHLAFLQSYDYVGPSGLLTESGLWASRLRVDQPLLIAEALRRALMPEDSPAALAGFMAAFVNDREASERFDRRHTPKPLLSRFLALKRGLRPFAQHLFACGFAPRPLFFRPALALNAWAEGHPWEEVCRLAELEEGNLANLILRTADHLRHLRNLEDPFPRVAAAAGRAVERILRQPVV
jgi:superfamily II RNA helicase